MTMKSLLAIVCTPAQQETIIDWLLMHESVNGFTSSSCNGHGPGHALSVAEQVSGRREQNIFWVELENQAIDSVMQQLRADMKGAHLHYWITPITESGVIN
jgi:hypothetical protein